MTKRLIVVLLTIIGSLLSIGYVAFYYLMHYMMLLNGYVYVIAPPYIWAELLLLYPLMVATPFLWFYLLASKTLPPSLPMEHLDVITYNTFVPYVSPDDPPVTNAT